MALGKSNLFRTNIIYSGVKNHSAVILCARLCIAQQNLSIGVNFVGTGVLDGPFFYGPSGG